MASAPTYDAADIDQVIADAASSGANSTSSSELYNRATQALYAPGSTFKIISLACALQEGIATETTMFEAPPSMDIGNAAVTNFEKHNYGTISLARATELSSNVVFGQLGVQIGAENLVNYAKLFGFNMDIDFDLPLATSVMPDAKDMTTWETAWAAAGEPVGESKTTSHPSPAGPQAHRARDGTRRLRYRQRRRDHAALLGRRHLQRRRPSAATRPPRRSSLKQ